MLNFFQQIDLDEEQSSSKDDDDVEELSQPVPVPVLKSSTDN